MPNSQKKIAMLTGNGDGVNSHPNYIIIVIEKGLALIDPVAILMMMFAFVCYDIGLYAGCAL